MGNDKEYAGWWTMDEKVSWSAPLQETTYVSSDTVNNAEEPKVSDKLDDNDVMYLTELVKTYGKMRSIVYNEIDRLMHAGYEVPEYLNKLFFLINTLDLKYENE
jgi:hypothetical protein